MSINLERLKSIDRYIIYAIYTSPNKEVLIKELKQMLMVYYRNHPELKLPSYQKIYGRVHSLIDLGVLYSKGENPLRVAVVKDEFNDLREYIMSFMKVQMRFNDEAN